MALIIDPEQEARIRETVARTGGETPETFVRSAIEEALLEAMLMEGLNSGDPTEATPEYWKSKREQLIARHQQQA